MDIPLETLIKPLFNGTSGFNIIHFRSLDHSVDSGGHFWVTISTGDGISILISIITKQMQKLEKRYRGCFNERAMNSLVPVSNDDFSSISIGCVINCNETRLVNLAELCRMIDRNYSSSKTYNCFDIVHFDQDFERELKEKIIQAIRSSPIVKPSVTSALNSL